MAITPDIEDDLVARIVDVAMAAQARAILKYAPIIRREIVVAIRGEFAGDHVYVGKGTAERNRERNEAIRVDRAAGLSLRELGRRHCLSKSQVSLILKGGG